MKRILYVTSIINPKGNGVAVAVSNYLKYGGKTINAAAYNLEDNIVSDAFSYHLSEYKNISSLPNGFASPDLVVFNEVYKPCYLKLYKECIYKNIPYIIIPHGCLVKKAQNRKRIKKILGNLLFFNRFIKKSLAIQYLNDSELKNSVIKNHKYIISSNGISIKKKKNNYKNKDFVYIGRYDIDHKGLDLIVDTVFDNKDWFVRNNIKINLYGPNSGDDYVRLRDMVRKNNLSDVLVLNDALYGNKKTEVLLSAYAFIQTSRYEGQPMGLLEALSYGLPCIVTYNTTFGEHVNSNKCGMGIDFNKEQLFDAIKKIYEDEKFRNICAKNTIKIESDYEWSKIMTECYKKYEALL